MTAAGRALLDRLFDYAGLFPPASLPIEPAVREYAAARAGAEGWMLGRFVVPAARLGELDAAVARIDPERTEGPWPVSVLLRPGEPAAFAEVATAPPALAIDAVDLPVATADEVSRAAGFLPHGPAWWFEVRAGAALGSTLAAIGEAGGGAKIRMGGTTPEAFPPPAEIARLLLACARARLAWKATAGLHHAVRGRFRVTGADDSPRVVMHGFVNLLVAAAVAADVCRDGYPEPEADAVVAAVLEETDRGAFRWSEDGVAWRTHAFDARALAAVRRAAARSIGSCDFDEPVGEARSLGLLGGASRHAAPAH